MEVVGEAVREHMLQNGAFEQNVVVLGIVTWGIILNKAALRDNNVSNTRSSSAAASTPDAALQVSRSLRLFGGT